jgi:phytoene dehydrogenase-like protein
MRDNWDVVVIGGGHNGLVAAAYLARAGLNTLVCERRDVVGGAAVSEHPFGPDYTVTSLSYVVSLLPADLVRDLQLDKHGYHVFPQGPYFAPRADGRYLRLPSDPAQRHAEISKFSAADAASYERYDAHMARMAAVLAPMLTEIPPRLGSHRPVDLIRQGLLLRHLRGVDTRAAVDLTRLLTGSIADLLDGYFESDALRGLLSVSGVIGTWAGPRSAGSAYVTLHHHIGNVDGQAGAWGFPRGGMGGVTGALAASARSFGVTLRTGAEVTRIRTRSGRVLGVALADGAEIDASTVITTAHPQISFLRLLDPAELPADFVADIRSWQSRSGTVKINLAVDRLPVFTSHPELDPQVHGGTIVFAESLDDLEFAYQDAVAGRPSAVPFADICIPSVFDDSLAPAGQHVVSMFTQWVPHTYADHPDDAAVEAYADRVLARMDAVAPGFASSVLHRQVIGPHRMQEEYGLVGGNIFHGELTLGQMFHARPAAGFADLRTPVSGLYQAGSGTHGGGGVTGIPGRNVVRQVLAYARATRWRRAGPGRILQRPADTDGSYSRTPRRRGRTVLPAGASFYRSEGYPPLCWPGGTTSLIAPVYRAVRSATCGSASAIIAQAAASRAVRTSSGGSPVRVAAAISSRITPSLAATSPPAEETTFEHTVEPYRDEPLRVRRLVAPEGRLLGVPATLPMLIGDVRRQISDVDN